MYRHSCCFQQRFSQIFSVLGSRKVHIQTTLGCHFNVHYVCSEGSHDKAVLLYEYVGKKTVDLQHTEVPEAYRGREIAKHLAKVVDRYSFGCTRLYNNMTRLLNTLHLNLICACHF